MVDNRKGQLRAADLPLAATQIVERSSARHLVNQVAVDVNQLRTAAKISDDMIVPDLVE
jgi:hypothetical protein